MRIKQFTGSSMKDVTERMKRELGPDALILHSRKIEGGAVPGAPRRELYEVTAAVDTALRITGDPARPSPGQDRTSPYRPFMHEEVALTGKEAFPEMTGRYAEISRPAMPAARSGGSPGGVQEEFQQFRQEVDALKITLKEVAGQLRSGTTRARVPEQQELLDRLISNEVDPSLAGSLVEAATTEGPGPGFKGSAERLVSLVAERITTAPPAVLRKNHPCVIALVGPTGVGKTTTIAKLSSIRKLVHHANVALISADTYRIGAVEQLHAFAQITDIPFEVAAKPQDIGRILRKFNRADIIYIDTVGRSQRMDRELEELRQLMDAAEPDEVHLVLSVTVNRKTLVDVVDRFKVLRPNRLIFSKLDEASAMGPVLSVLDRHSLPVSYVTNGQTVPYDILEADATQLAGMICRGDEAHA